ncbi:MAG TPA: TonB-dependent receptor [Bacteroidota bacterium]|nr:TonB-dependent receptor [Bacteroidota bacterium]
MRQSLFRSSYTAVLLLALIYGSFVSPAAAAGTLRGSVTTAGGAPIVGATVRILEIDRWSRTDGDGRFVFPNVPAGSYHVFVREIGYQTVNKFLDIADAGAELSFTLNESVVEEGEVVVSASPYPGPAGDQYQPAQSKTGLELDEASGSSFAEKLSDLPGVEVRYNGSAPARPVLRGLTDNEVLILENGLRTGDISTYDPAHSVPIEEQSIAQADVVHGPASIMFGPNAIGGLVNILTTTIPSPSASAVSGRASLEGNSVNDEYSGYFNTVFSGGGSAFGIFGGGVHSQDIGIPQGAYTDPASGAAFNLDRLPQTFNHTSEFGAGYSYEGDFGMLGVGAKHYEMNYGIPGVPPNADWASIPPATSRIMQRKNNIELRGLLFAGDSFLRQIKLNAGYVDYYHAEYPTAQDSTGVSDPEANNFHKQTFNATVQFQHRWSDAVQGTLGLWTNIEDLAIGGDQPLGPNSVTRSFAAYLFEEYRLAGGTRFQGAVRFDYNHIQTSPDPNSTDSVFQTLDETRTANAVTASVGVVQPLTNGWTAAINIGRSYRAPTVQELFADGLDAPSGTYTLGNAALSPEAGVGIDASLKGTLDKVSLEVSPYLNYISDYLYSYLRGDTLLNFPVRVFSSTDARLAGVEASVNFEPVEHLGVRVAADYVNAEDTKNDVPLPFTPPAHGLLRVRYQEDVWFGQLDWRLAAQQTRLADGETPTEGYGVVNIGAGFRFVQTGIVHNVSLHCDNLLNQVYRDHLSVIKDFLPQPGRGLRLNYSVSF